VGERLVQSSLHALVLAGHPRAVLDVFKHIHKIKARVKSALQLNYFLQHTQAPLHLPIRHPELNVVLRLTSALLLAEASSSYCWLG
jgi:hypothetical protein